MSISIKTKNTLKEAKFLAKGLCHFLENNTGDCQDNTDHYVINSAGVISNNRHTTNLSMMEGQPDNDATTEGQSLLILGFLEMYKGTKIKKYLDKAEYFWESYVKNFYQMNLEDIPDTPKRLVANWIINGKEPVLANYPINSDIPTHSGYLDVVLHFENGVAKVPEEYHGEYLDRATFAYNVDDKLLWNTIVADVVHNDYSDADKYEVEYIIDYLGRRIDYNGDIIDTFEDGVNEKGYIVLKDRTVNGDFKTCFSVKLPEDLGGVVIGRNEPYHNRPLMIPVKKEVYGNAADAEEWFYLGTKQLYEITSKEIYKKMLDCVKYTLRELIDVDKYQKFFRKSKSISPFTDGISYDYGSKAKYTRENDYIIMETTGYHGIEQSRVRYKVNGDSLCHVEYQKLLGDVSACIKLKFENNGLYELKINSSDLAHELPLSSFYRGQGQTVDANYSDIDTWSGVNCEEYFDTEINKKVAKISFTDDGGCDITNRSGSNDIQVLNNPIKYKTEMPVRLIVKDNNNIKWYADLTSTSWTSKTLAVSDFHLKRYGNTDEFDALIEEAESAVTAGTYAERWNYYYNTLDLNRRESLCRLLENEMNKTVKLDSNVEYVSLDLPDGVLGTFYFGGFGSVEYFSGVDYVKTFTLETDGKGELLEDSDEYGDYKVKIGDCCINNYLKNNLTYTPGIIPYSNIYNFDAVEIDSWHGCPFTGYQVPRIYDLNETEYLENMVNFLCDAQDKFFEKYNVDGPLMQTYVWNRYDNLSYGDPDTFIMEQWHDHAWDGYIARSFYHMADFLYSLPKDHSLYSKTLNFCLRFMNFLDRYYSENNVSPNTFNADGSIETDGYNIHMTPLYLCGILRVLQSGEGQQYEELAKKVFTEIKSHYVKEDHEEIMNGSWSSAIRDTSGSFEKSNGMFYGFHAGELLKCFGICEQIINEA
jgi:hypothetical protein